MGPLMGDLSDWARSRKERRRLALVVAALFAGAVAGGLLIDNAPIWAPVLPLTLTAGVVTVAGFGSVTSSTPSLSRPSASRASDPALSEIAGHGALDLGELLVPELDLERPLLELAAARREPTIAA